MVAAVERGGPAELVGLLVGDVLFGVDDELAEDVESLFNALARAGDAARLRVVRGRTTSEIEVDLRTEGPGRPA